MSCERTGPVRRIDSTLRFQILAQLLGIHVVSARVDIDKVRARSCLRDRFRGGDERMRNGEDDVARLELPPPSEQTAARRFRC